MTPSCVFAHTGLHVQIAVQSHNLNFRPLRGPMRCLFPRPPGTIRQKKVVVLEVVCSCLMAGSSPASHLFGLWDCTLDCHERRVCSCRITAVKFVCCSDNRWRPQLFTIQPSTADLLAMKNRIKWDGTSPSRMGGMFPSHFITPAVTLRGRLEPCMPNGSSDH